MCRQGRGYCRLWGLAGQGASQSALCLEKKSDCMKVTDSSLASQNSSTPSLPRSSGTSGRYRCNFGPAWWGDGQFLAHVIYIEGRHMTYQDLRNVIRFCTWNSIKSLSQMTESRVMIKTTHRNTLVAGRLLVRPQPATRPEQEWKQKQQWRRRT